MSLLPYLSTRGGAPVVSFPETVMAGLASDGGLYVPHGIPRLDEGTVRSFATMSFVGVFKAIMSHLAPDFDAVVRNRVIEKTYRPEVFRFVHDGDNPDDIVPLHEIGTDTYLGRLSNGPTRAFKDLPMQFLGNAVEALSEGRTYNVIGATSGDTGPAAIAAFMPQPNINTFIYFPREGMSAVQAAQAFGVKDKGVHNLIVEDFDDGQRLAKAAFQDPDFKSELNLLSINSINWARLAAQITYWFSLTTRVPNAFRDGVRVVVPSGNAGNFVSGDIARRMGAPIKRIVVATNENDVLHRFFETGEYKPTTAKQTTISPSMDISGASNFERFTYFLVGEDADTVRFCYEQLRRYGSFNLAGKQVEIDATGVTSECVSEAECREEIRTTYFETGIIIDPHTAVARAAARRRLDASIPTLVLETAAPEKFPGLIKEILGVDLKLDDALMALLEDPSNKTDIEPTLEALMDYVREHA